MITKEDLLKIATLSNLALSDEQLDLLVLDMQKIADFASAVNTSDIFSEADCDVCAPHDGLREDICTPSLDRTLILQNAHEVHDGFFAIKK